MCLCDTTCYSYCKFLKVHIKPASEKEIEQNSISLFIVLQRATKMTFESNVTGLYAACVTNHSSPVSHHT